MNDLDSSIPFSLIGKPLAQASSEWEEVHGELVKVQKNLFAILDDTADGMARGEMPIHGMLWAVSTGAALRAWFSEVEADDGATALYVVSPQLTFKPVTYSAILSYLKISDCPYVESASYRIMSDGKFVHKLIETKGTTYFFRDQEITDLEAAYAILHTRA
ncbi:hypothetical protein [Chitinolyticbacter albus]|uniref:hypothetical protein n=1 Tax=Chitinolyticbacter albus TaxID=2961951 RepID=UPI00210AC956|nr:hypothetical protein [Chitinolyticbacter albus]